MLSHKKSGTYALKDTDEKVIIEQKVTNDFKYLIVSAPELREGEYTLWNGDASLEGMPAQWNAGADSNAVPPQDDGEAPEKPQGEEPPEGMTPPDGQERPQKPEGEEPPAKPNGNEPPEMPEGMTPPEGNPQGGKGPYGKNDFSSTEEKSEIFSFNVGENYFIIG